MKLGKAFVFIGSFLALSALITIVYGILPADFMAWWLVNNSEETIYLKVVPAEPSLVDLRHFVLLLGVALALFGFSKINKQNN